MRKKLLENLDEMQWWGIEKRSNEQLNEIEEEYGIKFPLEDRNILRAYNCGRGLNIVMKIDEEEFKIKCMHFTRDNVSYYQNTLESYLGDKNIIVLIVSSERVPLDDDFRKNQQDELYKSN